jgi:hypothetical protein
VNQGKNKVRKETNKGKETRRGKIKIKKFKKPNKEEQEMGAKKTIPRACKTRCKHLQVKSVFNIGHKSVELN